MPQLETAGEVYFRDVELEWKIKNFSIDALYKSPIFKFMQRSWMLVCYSNNETKKKSVGWTGIYLMLEEACPRLALEISVSLKKMTGERVPLFSGVGTYKKKNSGWGTKTAIMKSTLKERNEELIPFNNLTIVVTLKIVFQDCKSTSQRQLKENVFVNLKSILTSGQNADVIFKLGDKEFPAHRLILESRSTVFATMFNIEMKEKLSGVVQITDINPDVFELVLLYLYCGEVASISADKVRQVFEVAHRYELTDLKGWCISFMEDNLSSNTILDTFILAELYELQHLQKLAKEYIAKNPRILDTDIWQTFAAQNPTVAIRILTFIVKKVTI